MEAIEWHVIRLGEVASTNTYLDRLDNDALQPEGCVVTTCSQSAGRGQRGNSWESEPGKNLTFSYLLRPVGVKPQEQFLLSQAASLAVVDVLSRYAEGFSVKWPNDIYYHDRKIAGILIEHTLSGEEITRTIVGIGLNVNQTVFRSDAPNPVSLSQITGDTHDLDSLLKALLDATVRRYRMCDVQRDRLRADYMQRLYRKTGFYRYSDKDGIFEAVVEDVLPDGRLVLRHCDGKIREYAFKEVSFQL